MPTICYCSSIFCLTAVGCNRAAKKKTKGKCRSTQLICGPWLLLSLGEQQETGVEIQHASLHSLLDEGSIWMGTGSLGPFAHHQITSGASPRMGSWL